MPRARINGATDARSAKDDHTRDRSGACHDGLRRSEKDERGGFSALDYGVVTTPKEETLPVRLSILERGVNAVLEKYRPDEIAFEELFFTKNITTGIAVAQARGVTLLTCVKKCPALYEYTPMQIKQAVTGYGKADKNRCRKWWRRFCV